MQVEIDVTSTYNNFGGQQLSGYGDTATFKNGKKFNQSELAQKIHASRN